YRRMVEGKTGGLFVLPARGAAQFAGAPPGLERAVATAAEHLGVLFQIQDDILDLYGDKGRDQRGNDLREGKISALVVRFAERAPQEEVDRLIDLLEAPRESVSASDVDWAAERFRESGALNAAAGDLDTEHRRAVESSGIGTHPELAALVDGLAELFTAPIGDVLEQTDSELH
ncbi:MAG: polyprenyl synthetase family protein, partial [Bradymonadaceae bacterium]